MNIVTKQYGADGQEFVSFSTIFAKRSDGSTASIKKAYRNSQVSESTALVLVDDLKQINAFHGVRAKFTTRLSPARAERLRVPADSSCKSVPGDLFSESAPQEVLGFTVLKKRQFVTAADGARSAIETWVSPQLDCRPLRQHSEIADASGNFIGREVMEVAVVQAGEPDAKLFAEPTGYAERSPSEIYAAESARLGDLDCRSCPRGVLSNSDIQYHGNKY
jgi:hypothetical protein